MTPRIILLDSFALYLISRINTYLDFNLHSLCYETISTKELLV
jgi:hypothetical protein